MCKCICVYKLFLYLVISSKFTWGSSGALCVFYTIMSYHLIISVSYRAMSKQSRLCHVRICLSFNSKISLNSKIKILFVSFTMENILWMT